ncbi:hypothetical protein B0H63DRAFT_556781 [Podospora didyma]|uniref:Uncharacterized protein n=1 Tax=Podospora didyma TaxID=330526 RepID=A0AAE0NY28_9PEZI|nr:hypothetical protein B0H63DRAFT_556781 [Podospora didyma]
MSLECNTTIKANSDVGGPGVIASFTAVAWLTIGLTAFPAWEEAKNRYQAWRRHRRSNDHANWHQLRGASFRTFSFIVPPPELTRHQTTTGQPAQYGSNSRRALSPAHAPAPAPAPVHAIHDTSPRPPNRAPRIAFRREGFNYVGSRHRLPEPQSATTRKVLEVAGLLCDLQGITGLGIVAAGLAQVRDESITYYHETLVVCFYFMTLNSFWAVRVNYLGWDAQDNRWRLAVRRLTILVLSALAIWLQILVYLRESPDNNWINHPDPESESDAGRCYKYIDSVDSKADLIFWISGQGVFTIALAFSSWHRTHFINQKIFTTLEFIRVWLRGKFEDARDRRHYIGRRHMSTSNRLWYDAITASRITGFAVLRVFWFLFIQLLDLWAYGEGFYPLSWVFYFLLLSWNTLDLVSIVVLNNHMLDEPELQEWGFGQILPLVVLLSIVYTFIDVFTEPPPRQVERLQDAFRHFEQRRGADEALHVDSVLNSQQTLPHYAQPVAGVLDTRSRVSEHTEAESRNELQVAE